MNVRAAINIVMGRLGNRTAPGLRTSILQEMAFCQENDLEGGTTLPWFIITEDATTKTKANERRVALPADFLRECEEKDPVQVVIDGQDIRLKKLGYDQAVGLYSDEQRGPPEAYALRGNYFIIFPTPDAEYTLKVPGYYARQDTPIDSEGSENPWFRNASDILIAKAGLVVSSLYLKDPELVEIFNGLYQAAKDRMFRADIARQEANRERNFGDD